MIIRTFARFNLRTALLFLVGLMLALLTAETTNASCPLCPAIGAQTISEEIQSADVAMIGELIEAHSASGNPDNDLANFKIVKFLKKHDKFAPKADSTIEVSLGIDAPAGTRFLITGVDPPEPAWNWPIKASKEAIDYIEKVSALGSKPVERLAFFQNYLESDDPTIAQDAYDEFARAPYEDVVAMKSKMDHDQIVRHLQPDAVPASRRRLFFMMLGVCGSKDDLPMLEEMLRGDDPQARVGIDALIACYLTLGGEKSLATVNELFLQNHKAEYTDTYSAVMALRFHGTEGGVFTTGQLVPLLRELLDRPRLADLVIPDLARWEDWSVIPDLVKMFKASDGATSWVRVPIFNYLKVCPLAEGKDALEELKKIDPDAFRRSNILFPFGDGDSIDDDDPNVSNEKVDS